LTQKSWTALWRFYVFLTGHHFSQPRNHIKRGTFFKNMGYIIGYIALAAIILFFVYDGMAGFDE
jgi:hypothetical protein